MKGFVKSSVDFISNHMFQIILVAVIFLLIRGFLVSRDIKFVKSKPHLEKVIVVESMTSGIKDKLYDNFSEQVKSADDGGKKICGKLKKRESCILTDCCGWAFKKNKKNSGICTPIDLSNDKPEPKFNMGKMDKLYYGNKKEAFDI